ncbi:MAG: hypothetical protein AAF984_10330 [Verrucomicrobiota bacterium]
MSDQSIKGLRAYILKTIWFPCPSYDELTLIGGEWAQVIEPDSEQAPRFVLDEIALVEGGTLKYLRRPGQLHNQHSGCFAFSHDTRFREVSEHPLPVYLPATEMSEMSRS